MSDEKRKCCGFPSRGQDELRILLTVPATVRAHEKKCRKGVRSKNYRSQGEERDHGDVDRGIRG